MLEAIFRRVLQAVFGGGADISAANPLPVDTSPGAKTVAEILNEAVIAAATTTTLADCDAVDLTGGPLTLALTVDGIYNAAAVLGIRLHVRTSPTNAAAGTHTAAAPSATIMTDAIAKFIVNELVGLTIMNITDGSQGVITANTVNTVTVAALAGGADNTWEQNDVYSIPGADYDTIDWDTWNPTFAAGLAFRQTENYDTHPMYAKVLVENLDLAQTVTLVTVNAARGV